MKNQPFPNVQKDLYLRPSCELFQLEAEGVLCQSGILYNSLSIEEAGYEDYGEF